VKRDERRPFIIESNGFRTKVLGTTFGIRAYEGSRLYQVTVTSGKVAVYSPADSLSLRPIYLTVNKQVQVNRQTYEPLVRTVNAANLMAWKQGGISFDREWLEEALRTIGNKHNVQFRISSEPLKQLTITADFDQGESLNNIINILNRVYKLQFVKEKNGMIEVQ
jgi:transmembrane sensor